MPKSFLTNINLNKGQILAGAFENLASAPATPVVGQFYFNTTSNIFFGWDGTVWKNLSYDTIPYNEVNAAGSISTVSITDVVVTSMTITPGAGTYLVFFNSDVTNGNANRTQFVSIYVNGVQAVNSEQQNFNTFGNQRMSIAVQSLATVAAAQAIDIRWRVSANTGSMGNRSLILIKVA